MMADETKDRAAVLAGDTAQVIQDAGLTDVDLITTLATIVAIALHGRFGIVVRERELMDMAKVVLAAFGHLDDMGDDDA